jgi:Vitamin K-dependent gamma-carboxylase
MMNALGESRFRVLGLARVFIGTLVLVRTTPLLAPLRVAFLRDTWPLLGWPPRGWHVAAFDLALPDGIVASLCVLRTIAVAAFTLGAWTRASGIATGALGYLALSQDALSYFNTLHLLYASTVLLALAGSGSRLALRRERSRQSDSGIALLRAFAVSVYAWGGIAKLNPDWLQGDALEQFSRERVIAGMLADAALGSRAGRLACAWTVVALELALGPLLLCRATRRFALPGALAFHVLLEGSVHPDVFGFAMAALLVTFWEPHWQGPSQCAASAGQTMRP